MPGKPAVIVGVESCTDIKADTSIDMLRQIASSTKSGMSKELLAAIENLSNNRDGEIAADGKDSETLILELKKAGAKITASLGGNPALESSQMISLGAKVYFAGSFFGAQKKMGESFLKNADFEFARKSNENPVSIVLQNGNSRFIICNGRGRRINDLRNYISELPEIINSITKKETISAISLPSWHVLFANGISKKDMDLITGALAEIRKKRILMFTDTGGFGNLNDNEIQQLWKIYGAFDIISMNESEFEQLCKIVLNKPREITAENIPESLSELLQKSIAHTIWLHTREFQISISKKYGEKELKRAQENAAAAGVLHVESGKYPNTAEILQRIMSKNVTELHRNATHEKTGISVSQTPTYIAQKITSEVGAGDISAAAYLWSILENQNNKNKSME